MSRQIPIKLSADELVTTTYWKTRSLTPSVVTSPIFMPRTGLLSIREGDNLVNVEEDTLPYVYKRVLGQGHTSWVEEVQDELTNEVYARKRLPIVRYKREERAEIFKNEIAIIRGLDKHHHMIHVFATYVTSTNFGLILQPVASDGDLHAYLATFKELSDQSSAARVPDVRLEMMAAVLKRAFGCLTAALAFMHDKRIRHKDVKPRNILVDNGRMLYTDFGYAFDSSSSTNSTTEGAPNALTKRYSSPELLMHEPRNSKSDVFSLGCVLAEILAALIRDDVLENALNLGFASAMLDSVHNSLSLLQHTTCPAELIETVIQMTQRDSVKRISSCQAQPNFFVCLHFAVNNANRHKGLWKRLHYNAIARKISMHGLPISRMRRS